MWYRSSTSAKTPKTATETETAMAARAIAPAFILHDQLNAGSARSTRPVGGDQPGFADHGLAAGGTQARRFEIRPRLLRAVTADHLDVEPVAFGEGLRNAGFDLRRKTGKNGERSSNKRSDGDCRNCLDHDGAPVTGPLRPVFVNGLIQSSRFRMSSPRVQYGFVLPEFCFVAAKATKHGALTSRRRSHS